MISAYLRHLWSTVGISSNRVNPIVPVDSGQREDLYEDESDSQKGKRTSFGQRPISKNFPGEISGSYGDGVAVNLSIWV